MVVCGVGTELESVTDAPHTALPGAGFSGIAAARVLDKFGYEVTLFEKAWVLSRLEHLGPMRLYTDAMPVLTAPT